MAEQLRALIMTGKENKSCHCAAGLWPLLRQACCVSGWQQFALVFSFLFRFISTLHMGNLSLNWARRSLVRSVFIKIYMGTNHSLGDEITSDVSVASPKRKDRQICRPNKMTDLCNSLISDYRSPAVSLLLCLFLTMETPLKTERAEDCDQQHDKQSFFSFLMSLLCDLCSL